MSIQWHVGLQPDLTLAEFLFLFTPFTFLSIYWRSSFCLFFVLFCFVVCCFTLYLKKKKKKKNIRRSPRIPVSLLNHRLCLAVLGLSHGLRLATPSLLLFVLLISLIYLLIDAVVTNPISMLLLLIGSILLLR
jgi:amino acid transporter